MLDIKQILADPTRFDADMARRGSAVRAEQLIAVRNKHVAQQQTIQQTQTVINELSRRIGQAKQRGEDPTDLLMQVSEQKQQLTHLDINLADQLNDLLLTVPNLLDPTVVDGTSEADNTLVYQTPGELPVKPKQHYDFGLIDFLSAAKISGARFSVLQGSVARLERALGQFMLDQHVEAGFTEVSVPLLVNSDALYGTGQLPKFKEDLYSVGDKWLIPTAEVPLTNLLRDTLEDKPTVHRFTALTPCFRSEAGAAGRDVRGMIRQHQFHKVELVSIFPEEQAMIEHNRVLQSAESILQSLQLPYRTMRLCSGDTGFSSMLTYDIEVWLPGQKAFREISSVSYCGDFQARRMNAKYRGDGKTHFYHTVNGSGLAVGRTLIAVLENYQEDSYISIPKALQSYMGGLERIEFSV